MLIVKSLPAGWCIPVDPKEPDKRQAPENPWALALNAGAELVGCTLAGLLLGQWLDTKLGTGPWLMLAGAMAGITGGLYRLVQGSARRRDHR